MTLKLPTIWRSNSAKASGSVRYSDATVTYSSAMTAYSSTTAMLNTSGKVAKVWSHPGKSPTVWSPTIRTNRRKYDTHIMYDTHVTYDGAIVTPAKKATVWK